MAVPPLPLLFLTVALLLTALSSVSGQSTLVQWGYSFQCPPNTLDSPCLIQVTGTANISTTLTNATSGGLKYQYYQMISFTGTRVYTNRFGATVTASATLAPTGEIGAKNLLVVSAAALTISSPTFRLGSTIQFPGGLLGNELRFVVAAGGYMVENIGFVGNSNTNSENSDPTSVMVCSTASGFIPSPYNATSLQAAFYTTMAPCQAPPPFPTNNSYSLTQTTPGLQTFAFSYTVTDNSTFAAQVNSVISTDGTINYDSLGNLYYNVIAITGTRSEQSLINSSAVSTVFISSLMAPNIIFTSNLPYITNNNRIYPQYPFLDRYGLAYTVTSKLGSVTEPELEDGSISSYTNVVGVYIYRLDTLDEQGLDGLFTFPPFNTLNQNLNALTLISLPNPPNYQLVSFCYVMYGLPQTLDYPWSVVMSGTALINATVVYRSVSSGVPSPQVSYPLVGFVGTRTYTNRFGAQLVNALTADAIGEDADVAVLVPQTPYSASNSVSFHLNSTIQTPGGLMATDISWFLDPYPCEGTGFGYGVGSSTNALNNDPSKTLFVSNMPGFVNSTYSNSNPASLAGNSTGTTDLSQCKASFPTVSPPAGVAAPGIRVYQMIYNLTATSGYSVWANLTLITDGTVGVDQLGNYYYTLIAINGVRLYSYLPNNSVISNVSAVAVAPICGGIDSNAANAVLYCNNNRIYPQYPFVDRVGFGYQTSAPVPTPGKGTTPVTDFVALTVYRHVALEESHSSANPSSNLQTPNGFISLTQIPSASSLYTNFSWGYIMYCLPSALEYPCAVVVQGNVLVASSGSIVTTCDPSATYTYLCNGVGYVILGFVGTRTFYGKYGQTQLAYLAIQPVGEDFADDVIYTAAPYVDSLGPTFGVNGTDNSLTEVLGGFMTNEINVFLDPQPSEGIAVNGQDPSAVLYDPSLTTFCSNMPGFIPATYNASNLFPSGSTDMTACLPSASFTRSFQKTPTFTKQLTGQNYTLAFSESDGTTFAVQTIVTFTTDGGAYADTLGNLYSLVVAANGTRTYYNWRVSPAQVTTTFITGVLPIGSFVTTTGSLVLTGNVTTNRLYPFASPHLDSLGIAFNLSSPSPATGNTVSSNITTFAVYKYYKDGTLREAPTGGRTANPVYQTVLFNSGTVLTAGTLPAVAPAQTATLCFIFYSLPGNVDYPFSIATSLSFTYNPVPVTSKSGTAVTLVSGRGTRVFTNRFGTVFSTPLTLASSGTDFADNLLYLNSSFPVDGSGLTWILSSAVQLPGHGPLAPVNVLNIWNSSGVIIENDSFRIDPQGSAFVSTVPGFRSITIGASNLNALAANYTSCQAPISFTNGLRTPTQPSNFNGAVQFSYSYFISDGVRYSVQANLTITCTSAFATLKDQLGNPYQQVTNIVGTRVYTYLPTSAQITSTVTGLSTAAYANADQRFYPYALLSSAPGLYTMNTAPFLDYDGLEFYIFPSTPEAGAAPGIGTQYNATSVYFSTSATTATLTDGFYTNLPDVNLQQQIYALQ